MENARELPKVGISFDELYSRSNAVMVLSLFRAAARRAGWTERDIDAVCAEAKSGDYDHLMETILAHAVYVEDGE